MLTDLASVGLDWFGVCSISIYLSAILSWLKVYDGGIPMAAN